MNNTSEILAKTFEQVETVRLKAVKCTSRFEIQTLSSSSSPGGYCILFFFLQKKNRHYTVTG